MASRATGYHTPLPLACPGRQARGGGDEGGVRTPAAFHALAVLALFVVLAALTSLPAAAQDPTPRLVRIGYQDKTQLSAMDAAGWDIWEVHPDYAVGIPPGGTAPQSAPAGVILQDYGPVPPALFSGGYRTYPEMVTALQTAAAAHPGVVTLIDIGDGWEKTVDRADRDIWAARLSARPGLGLPQVLYVGGHHAREIAGPEVALNLVDLLSDGYGVDPLITYLLNNREVWIVPMANPDGHIRAEDGSLWRKNVDDANGACYPDYWWATPGIDLNRNFNWEWGWGGSSPYACDETYRGPSAFSEPEDRALRDLVNANHFTASISYHAYGDQVLYPWGYTDTPPADGGLMSALATKMAWYSGYSHYQSIGLYPTNGDLCDWTWGAAGLPCFTVEMGESFMPPFSAVPGLWNENRPGALYLLNVADRLWRVSGPEVTSVQAVTWTGGVTITAWLDSAGNGGGTIAAAEVFTTSMTGAGADGTGLAMSPLDGAWSAPQEVAVVALPTLSPGRHLLTVRGRDAAGHWGSLGAVWVGEPLRVYFPLIRKGM